MWFLLVIILVAILGVIIFSDNNTTDTLMHEYNLYRDNKEVNKHD